MDDKSDSAVDPELVRGWLAARSVARGLPAPVADHGGYRVDTGSEAEVRRWVFPHMVAGLGGLARSLSAPRHMIKYCGSADRLRAALPGGWQLHPPGYLMIAGQVAPTGPLADDYRLEVTADGAVIAARILSPTGALAASGYAATAAGVFVYDRIVTEPGHRRIGLGGAIMAALRQAKADSNAAEALVATNEGRALYVSLGWRVISLFVTASIPEG